MLLTPAQTEPKSFQSRRPPPPHPTPHLFSFFFFLLFLPGVNVSHVYVRARALGCFQSYQYPNLSEGADRVSGQLRGDKQCSFCGVTKSGRVWREMPESDARSMVSTLGKKEKKKSSVSFQMILVLFELAWAAWSVIEQTSDIIWVVCNKRTTVWALTQNCTLTDSFLGPVA